MRSRTPVDLPGRCKRCYLRERHCLCAELPVVRTETRFLVIRHAREAYKSTGTVRVAGLAMPQLEIRPYGARFQTFDPEGLTAEGSFLLFPSDEGPTDVAPSPAPKQVVVLDGTWSQTKAMVRRIPELARLPRLHLRPRDSRLLRLRAPPNPEGMSTLEAIARAVALLEGEARAAPLESLHAKWVERCLQSRGKRLEDAWAEVDARLTRVAQPKMP